MLSNAAERRTVDDGAGTGRPAYALSIVVPTLNEVDNVRPLLAALATALAGRSWEVLFVDDNSPDGTADLVASIGASNPQVRCLRRVGRRGLSSACLEGFQATNAPFVAVMDGDLQHDERLLPAMLTMIEAGGIDLVVGSRYAPGGSVGDFAATRLGLSRLGTWAARRLLGLPLGDPLSGFFMLRRDLLTPALLDRLSGQGFKLLLDLFASSDRPIAFRELPFGFRQRVSGESKLGLGVAWDFLRLLVRKRLDTGRLRRGAWGRAE
jgi:dolichol-phosphate mannosyltransferase